MTIARVDVRVVPADPATSGWRVTVRDPAGEVAAMVVPALAPTMLVAGAPVAIADAIGELRTGQIAPARAHALGRHLFDALLAASWPAVLARVAAAPPTLVELALDLDDPGAAVLRGHPWELMAAPAGWLAGGVVAGTARLDIAITRRTARGVASAPALAHPLRYLFVVGTSIDDGVRAGAECLGLLRQIYPTVQERIVQRQSPAELAAVVAAFDPHVVHVICHGRETEQGAIQLQLWDASRNEAAYVEAGELADRLVRDTPTGRRAPAIVVLSACSSGDRLASPGGGDLARALVGAGVPMVIGMAAEIRDQACRLFARGLGDALVDRTPVVIAAARGRRQALRANLPDDAFDWGLVQVLLGADVDAAAAVAPAGPNTDEAKVLDWLGGAALPLDVVPGQRTWPPLCGGNDLVESLYQLLGGRHAALILIAQPPRDAIRVGKRRAFAELAAAAIRAGQVPVIVLPTKKSGWPRTPAQLVERLREAVAAAWIRHELGPAPALALAAVTSPAPATTEILAALELDCRALREAARAAHTFVAQADGQVVLMLHDVHAYGDGAQTVLELLTARGAMLRRIAPTIVSWKITPPEAIDTSHRALDDDLRDTLTRGRAWLRTLELTPLAPLDAARDDLGLGTIPVGAKLALQHLLLNPYRANPAYAAMRWFLDLRRESDPLVRTLKILISNTYGCCPGQFADEAFLFGLVQARDVGALTAATDDDVLNAGGPA